MVKTIYSLVVINEDMNIVSVSAYPTKEAARKGIIEDYNGTKEMLEAEGWPEGDLSNDELEIDHYWIQYGESSYYAEIMETNYYED